VVARPENIFLKLDLDNTSERIRDLSKPQQLKTCGGFAFLSCSELITAAPQK
jgi:hypothetical protein